MAGGDDGDPAHRGPGVSAARQREDAGRVVRADNLGSFLRPRYLLEARTGRPRSRAPTCARWRTEPSRRSSACQEDLGLRIVTDGEFRRKHFFSTLNNVADRHRS